MSLLGNSTNNLPLCFTTGECPIYNALGLADNAIDFADAYGSDDSGIAMESIPVDGESLLPEPAGIQSMHYAKTGVTARKSVTRNVAQSHDCKRARKEGSSPQCPNRRH